MLVPARRTGACHPLISSEATASVRAGSGHRCSAVPPVVWTLGSLLRVVLFLLCTHDLSEVRI